MIIHRKTQEKKKKNDERWGIYIWIYIGHRVAKKKITFFHTINFPIKLYFLLNNPHFLDSAQTSFGENKGFKATKTVCKNWSVQFDDHLPYKDFWKVWRIFIILSFFRFCFATRCPHNGTLICHIDPNDWTFSVDVYPSFYSLGFSSLYFSISANKKLFIPLIWFHTARSHVWHTNQLSWIIDRAAIKDVAQRPQIINARMIWQAPSQFFF